MLIDLSVLSPLFCPVSGRGNVGGREITNGADEFGRSRGQVLHAPNGTDRNFVNDDVQQIGCMQKQQLLVSAGWKLLHHLWKFVVQIGQIAVGPAWIGMCRKHRKLACQPAKRVAHEHSTPEGFAVVFLYGSDVMPGNTVDITGSFCGISESSDDLEDIAARRRPSCRLIGPTPDWRHGGRIRPDSHSTQMQATWWRQHPS